VLPLAAFALLIAGPAMLVVRRKVFKALWVLYPVVVTFVVVVTGSARVAVDEENATIWLDMAPSG